VLPDLPRKRYETVVCAIDKATRKLCDGFMSDWQAEHGAVQALEELPDFREFSALRAKLAASRIAAAVEIVEDSEDAGVPLLVFSAHRAPIEEIGKREGWAAILGGTPADERQRIVEDFQAGKLRGVALTIAAGGVGLTLTHAATALFVDLDWVPGNNAQAEDRMVRIGQTADMIRIVRLVSDHILDRHVQALLEEKQELVAGAIERVVSYEIPAEDTADVLDETEEQWQARVAAMRDRATAREVEQARAEASSKVAAKVRDLRVRGRVLPVAFDEAHAEAIRRAGGRLAAMCDGAVTKDGAGFSKPDAFIGRWLSLTEMADLKSLQLGWAIVQKYRGQVGQLYPAAFDARTGWA
jgi:hypothetical protein